MGLSLRPIFLYHLYDNNQKVSFVMRWRLKDIALCLDRAKEMEDNYKLYALASDGFPRRVDDFTDICTQCLGHKIIIRELLEPAGDGSVRATFIAAEVGLESFFACIGLTDTVYPLLYRMSTPYVAPLSNT